jgi:hypothetical protein
VSKVSRVMRWLLVVGCVIGVLGCRPESEGVPLTVLVFAGPAGGWEFHVPVCHASGLILRFELGDSHGAEISGRSTYVEGRPARVVILTVDDRTLADNSFNVDEVAVGSDDRTKQSPRLADLNDVLITTSDAGAAFTPESIDGSTVAEYRGLRRSPVRTFARAEADDQRLLADFCGSLE